MHHLNLQAEGIGTTYEIVRKADNNSGSTGRPALAMPILQKGSFAGEEWKRLRY